MACSRVGRFLQVALFASLAAGLVGCAPPAADVSGTVKLNGKAPNMKGLEITFTAPDGRMFAAPIKEDGTYKAEKVGVGEARVAFSYLPPELAAKEGAGKPRMVKPGAGGELSKTTGPKVNDPIPKVLRDPATSKVTTTLQAGKANVFDYDIK